jgi:uncharacterized membrane-anchored protein YitT (DUF2179 family)
MPLVAALVGALFVGVGAGLCVRVGGDSEFINYLKYILQKKYVQNVYEF